MMFGWLICKVKGKHRRGVRVGFYKEGVTENGMPLIHEVSPEALAVLNDGKMFYRCPRCGAVWTRKVRHAAA